MKDMTKEQLMKELIHLGVRPKYKAFSYLVFMLLDNDIESICLMKEKDVLNAVSAEFGIPPRMAERNFRTLTSSFFLTSGGLVNRSLPFLGKDEFPSAKEFIIIIACYLSAKSA